MSDYFSPRFVCVDDDCVVQLFDPEVLAALPEDIRREIASHPSQFQAAAVKSANVVNFGSRNEHDVSLLLPDGSKVGVFESIDE